MKGPEEGSDYVQRVARVVKEGHRVRISRVQLEYPHPIWLFRRMRNNNRKKGPMVIITF